MKKAKRLILGGLSALLGAVSLSSCGFFATSTDAVGIDEVVTRVDTEGNTVLTITYTDPEMPSTVVTLPKGETGEGIESATAVYDEESETVTLTITYTDEREDVTLTYPVLRGVGIDHMVVNYQGDTDVALSFYLVYTDGTNSDIITLPVGNGIASVTCEEGTVEVDGATINGVTVTITLDDGTVESFFLQEGPKGDTGTGIADIQVTMDPVNGVYVMTITFDDENATTQTVELTGLVLWFVGQGHPSTARDENGNSFDNYPVGTYYVDTISRTIYYKTNSGWVVWMDLNISHATYTVNLHPGEGSIPEEERDGLTQRRDENSEVYFSLAVEEMATFVLPTPVRDGYTFTGWYTSDDLNDVNAGRWTDATPVTRDMDLYARYEPDTL